MLHGAAVSDWRAQDSAEAAAAPAIKGAVVAAADEAAGDAAAADGNEAAEAEVEEGGRGRGRGEGEGEREAARPKPDRSLVGPAPKLLSAGALARASEETRARHAERRLTLHLRALDT